MKTSKDIRRGLKMGEATIGTWLQIPSSDIAEIVARMGYEWAAVDLEHGAITRAFLPDMFRALERWGTLPFARLAEPSRRDIKMALDSGARGLIFPMIESRKQLDDAISWSIYPNGTEFNSGTRGVGFSRANAFGIDFPAHVKADGGDGQEIVLVAQIENVNALIELDDIFSHPRLDAYMIGPYDLSASMGLTAQFDHPEFLAAIKTIEDKASAHSVPKGFHVVEPNVTQLKSRLDSGYVFIAYGIDSLFLQRVGACPKVQ